MRAFFGTEVNGNQACFQIQWKRHKQTTQVSQTQSVCGKFFWKTNVINKLRLALTMFDYIDNIIFLYFFLVMNYYTKCAF